MRIHTHQVDASSRLEGHHPRRRIIRRIVGSLLVLLAGMVLISALSNLGLPTSSQVVDRLHPLEKARLAEVTHLRQALGDQLWSGWGEMEIPLLVYNEEQAFLTGYDTPPMGWLTVPGGEQRGTVWEPVPGDSFDGLPYYRQPLQDGVTPQAFIVSVGGRSAASLTTMEWMKIALRQEIGQQLPAPITWIIPYRILDRLFLGSSDWYIALVLHESFHAYQNNRAPGYLAAAEQAISRYEQQYPWDDERLKESWQAELNLLSEAASSPADESDTLVRQFLALRDQRRTASRLSPELAAYEQRREWLEGLAKYTELEIWRLAAHTQSYVPLSSMAQDPWFGGYGDTFEQRWSEEVAQIRRMADDPGDGRFYYSGWAQALLLDRLATDWKQAALNEGTSLETLLREAISRQP